MYNVAHFKRRNSRGRAKMEKRREHKYCNASVVMLVFFIYLKSMQLVTITVKKSTGGSRFDYATYWVLTVKVVTKTQCNSIL